MGDYDTHSIMHYHSNNNMKALNPEEEKNMGQRINFSELDIKSINFLYPKMDNNEPYATICTYDVFGDEYFN